MPTWENSNMKIRVQMVCGGVSAYQNDFKIQAEAISTAETLAKGCGTVKIVTKDSDIIHYQTTKGYIRVFFISEEPAEVLFHMGDAPEAGTLAEANVRKMLGLLSGKKVDDPSINAAIQQIIDQPNVTHAMGVFQLQYRVPNPVADAGQ